jgi:hypothetical protein
MNPNHIITWPHGKPEFSIRHLRGSSTNRGYHEDYYEVLSLRKLYADAFKCLDDAYLLGSGQTYRVVKEEVVEEVVQPAVVDKRTGKVVEGEVPRNYRGEPYTQTNTLEWHRYEVLRICDSGD